MVPTGVSPGAALADGPTERCEPQAQPCEPQAQPCELPAHRAAGARRRRRWLRRVLATLSAFVVLTCIAVGSLLAAVPSVATAQSLVRRELASHEARAVRRVPPKVADALIAIEDQVFGSPPGVDIAYGLVRYAYARLLGRTSQGGATLAQQLAKRLYTPGGRSVLAKVEQVGLALKLELTYSHRQILTMYVNDVYFGAGAWGLADASARYFHRPPSTLDWAQASLLAGLVQAPSRYDPLRHPHLALERRDAVVTQLEAMGILSAAEAHRVAAQPIL